MNRLKAYEKVLSDLVLEYHPKFFYEDIYKTVYDVHYKINIKKERKEMVGRAIVTLQTGDRIEYELRYNRIVNLKDNYILAIPGLRV